MSASLLFFSSFFVPQNNWCQLNGFLLHLSVVTSVSVVILEQFGIDFSPFSTVHLTVFFFLFQKKAVLILSDFPVSGVLCVPALSVRQMLSGTVCQGFQSTVKSKTSPTLTRPACFWRTSSSGPTMRLRWEPTMEPAEEPTATRSQSGLCKGVSVYSTR